jgi:hypothetical protein
MEESHEDIIFESIAKRVRELDPMGFMKKMNDVPAGSFVPDYPLPYFNQIQTISSRIEKGECHNPVEIQTLLFVVFAYDYALQRALPISKYGKAALAIFEDIRDSLAAITKKE